MKEERLEQIQEALGERNMYRRGLREESPVSEKLWNSRNDQVTIAELRELIDSHVTLKDQQEAKKDGEDHLGNSRGPKVDFQPEATGLLGRATGRNKKS